MCGLRDSIVSGSRSTSTPYIGNNPKQHVEDISSGRKPQMMASPKILDHMVATALVDDDRRIKYRPTATPSGTYSEYFEAAAAKTL